MIRPAFDPTPGHVSLAAGDLCRLPLPSDHTTKSRSGTGSPRATQAMLPNI
jgi:hypothetical protein